MKTIQPTGLHHNYKLLIKRPRKLKAFQTTILYIDNSLVETLEQTYPTKAQAIQAGIDQVKRYIIQ